MRQLFFLILLFPTFLLAQYEQQARNAFLQTEVTDAFDYWNITRPDYQFHSSFKPYLSSTFHHASDTLVPFRFYAFRNYFLSRTVNEKPENRNWFNLQFHPIIEASVGYDQLLGQVIPEYIGGMHFKTNINNDFTFAGTAVGGKISYPFFNDTNISTVKILPGYGQAYGNNKKGYEVSDFTGYVSYSPQNNKIFNFQAGRDRHFIGDGYRSVLLSDVAPAYPFLRINTNIWHLQYNVWYTMLNDVSQANGRQKSFIRKFATFHYLSYNMFKGVNIAIFENVVWRGSDSSMDRSFDVNYLNPVIFYRPVEYSLGSPDNAFLGLNVNAKIGSRLKLYGQIGLDEFFLDEIRAHRGWWANKQAWQLGAKYINAFGVNGLSLQGEYNEVRPYTYTHGIVQQNYAHYGSPLAHPFGANFRELLSVVKWRQKNLQLSAKLVYALMGRDSLGSKANMGQNIFLSYTTRPYEYGHYTGQGVQNNFYDLDLRVTYFIIPDMNLRFELGFMQRAIDNTEGYILQNPYVFFAIRSGIWNSYRDQ